MKSEQEERKMKKHFSKKFQSLQSEVETAKKEVDESKKILEESRTKADVESSEKQKIEMEYKKKLHSMESKLQALKKKQKVCGRSFCLLGLLSDTLVDKNYYYLTLLEIWLTEAKIPDIE